MPGAPDGEYVVIQYRAAFANKAEAVETVTPMLDKGGTWRCPGTTSADRTIHRKPRLKITPGA